MAKNKAKSKNRLEDRAAKRPRELTYFLSVSLKNVRCFGDEPQVLDLSDGSGRPAQWTILLGDNGSGKTTVLQALVLSTAPQPARTGVSAERSTARVLDQFIGLLALRRRRRGNGAALGIVACADKVLSGSEGSAVPFEWEVPIVSSRLRNELGGDPSWGELYCYAYGAGRRIGSLRLSEDVSDDPTATLLTETATLRSAEEWLLKLDYAASKSKRTEFRQRLNQVKGLLTAVLPEVDDIRFTQPAEEQPTPRVEFQTPDGWIPLDGISYGYRTMIGWMVDFASRMVERYPDSKDPLAEPAVVLVDEIDLHLHPKWQRQVMRYLSDRFPNTQFIASAHSPLIVQAAPSVNANIAVLRRVGDHVVIDNDVEVVRGWRADQILTSDLYDLPTARPAEFDEAIERRTKLLSKSRLTKADKKELAELDQQLDQLPAGENAHEARELMALAKDTAELLKRHRGEGQ